LAIGVAPVVGDTRLAAVPGPRTRRRAGALAGRVASTVVVAVDGQAVGAVAAVPARVAGAGPVQCRVASAAAVAQDARLAGPAVCRGPAGGTGTAPLTAGR
jgi:hypothetical protein